MFDLKSDAPLGHRLVQAAKMHRGWVSSQLEGLGLYVGQELLLAQLCREDGIRQTSLARVLGIELPTTNKMLRRLETSGFVERRSDPDDARASLAYLTPQGRRMCEGISEIWQAAERRLRQALSSDDAAQLERLLGELTRRSRKP
jgi:DNA-binding MarR family transcriptional regulator